MQWCESHMRAKALQSTADLIFRRQTKGQRWTNRVWIVRLPSWGKGGRAFVEEVAWPHSWTACDDYIAQPSLDGLLADVFWVFLSHKVNAFLGIWCSIKNGLKKCLIEGPKTNFHNKEAYKVEFWEVHSFYALGLVK